MIGRFMKNKTKKIKSGTYIYKSYILQNYGYHDPDKCVWWQAINIDTNCADFHANTKKELIEEIDIYD